jgi:phospholipase/lecithinase/hemolysin
MKTVKLIAILAFVAVPTLSRASSYDALYAFGDSLSDVGNIYSLTGGAEPAAPYVNGQFSNGPVWVQDLAAGLGLPALKPYLPNGTGTDYAFGGAQSGTTPVHTATPIDLPTQLADFATAHPTADPHALYTIWIGSNDLFSILSKATPPEYAADAAAVVGNIDAAINSLAGDGAKNFLILTVPDLGKTPSAAAGGPAVEAGASALAAAFNNLLINGSGPIPSLAALAATDSAHLTVLDTYALIDAAVGDPGKFGFTNVTDPCLTGAVNYSGGTVCATPGSYLFWDDLHPTARGHALVAAAALAAVPEPATLGLLALGFAAMGFARRKRNG